MPFWRFTVLTALGCIPWVFMLAFIGKQAGDHWESWKEHLHYVDYAVIAAIVIGVVWLFVRYRRRRGARPPPSMPPELLQVAALGPDPGRGRAAAGLLVRARRRGAVAAGLGGREWAPERRKELEVALHAGALARAGAGVVAAAAGRADARAVAGAAGDRRATCWSGRSRSGSAGRSGWRRGCCVRRRARCAAGGRGAGARRAAGAGRGARRRGARRGWRSGSRRPRRSSRACRGPARRSPPRGRSGYSRAEASRLSFGVAGPVLAGATALKAWRGRQRRRPRLVATGGAAAFAGHARPRCALVGLERRRPLWPYAAERGAARGRHPRRALPSGAVSTDAYARSGVDQHAADRAVAALVGVLKTIDTGKRVALGARVSGHYAAVLEVAPNLGIAVGTDGVGSKLILAEQTGRYDTVGIDCVAMNVNDVVCVGAEPIALLDYLAVEQADPEVMEQIGIGLKNGAELAGVEIPGGEVAILPELIRGHPSPNGFDLTATCFGTVALDQIDHRRRRSPRRRADRPARAAACTRTPTRSPAARSRTCRSTARSRAARSPTRCSSRP